MFKTIFFVIFGICGLLADSPPNSINPQIEEILSQISADNIANIQKKLESFGTRNIYSATDDPSHGIGAAREWIADAVFVAAALLWLIPDRRIEKRLAR